MIATYKKRSANTDRNKWKIVVLFGYWPMRSELHKGYLKAREFASRVLTDQEEAKVRENWRYTSYTYKSLEDLLNDERNILGKEHPFIDELIEKYDTIL